MAIYLVLRTDMPDYDEYDELIVRAASEDEARRYALASERCRPGWFMPRWPGMCEDNIIVREIAADGEHGVLGSSFRAG